MKAKVNTKLTKVLFVSTFCFFISNFSFGQDTLQKKKAFLSHQLCFGPQWIQWAWDEYNNAQISYLKQSYLGFYKVVLMPKESIMKFAITLNGSYTTGDGDYSSTESSYRDSYRGKFENYWLDINPCIYFALGKRKNLLIGGGPFYGRLLFTQNNIQHTITKEPIGAPPTSTTTKDDKILNRTKAGASLEVQQKIVIKKNRGIVIGLRLMLTSTDGFVTTLVPAANPYIGISF